jgi:hypothetical protein
MFYSIKYDDDGYCKNLIALLERHGLTKLFEPKLIDNMTIEQLSKSGLDDIMIPAIIVISENGEQKYQNMYQSHDAFKWVENFLIGRRRATIVNAENSRKLIQNNNIKEKLSQKLYEYCPSEHSGISDGYAFYNEDESKDSNIAQGKMFSHGFSHTGDNLGAVPLPGAAEYRKREGLNATHGGSVDKVLKDKEYERAQQDLQLKGAMNTDAINIIMNKMNK